MTTSPGAETGHAIAPAFTLERVPGASDRPSRHVLQHVAELFRHMEAESTGGGVSPSAVADGARGPAGLVDSPETVRELIVTTLSRPFPVSLTGDRRLVTPPYDSDLEAGGDGGTRVSPAVGGEMLLVATPTSAEQVGGFGVRLRSSEVPLHVSITPAGTWGVSWAARSENPALQCHAGLAILVSASEGPDPDGAPVSSRRTTLLRLNGLGKTPWPHRKQGDLAELQDFRASAGGFYRQRFVPLTFEAGPGQTYELWFWSWLQAQSIGDAFVALFASVPVITVEAWLSP